MAALFRVTSSNSVGIQQLLALALETIVQAQETGGHKLGVVQVAAKKQAAGQQGLPGINQVAGRDQAHIHFPAQVVGDPGSKFGAFDRTKGAARRRQDGKVDVAVGMHGAAGGAPQHIERHDSLIILDGRYDGFYLGLAWFHGQSVLALPASAQANACPARYRQISLATSEIPGYSAERRNIGAAELSN